MTIICDFCGCENHLEADFCEECGKPIKKDQVYVVCSICGISNPNTAATCIGCGEPLDNKSFTIDEKKDKSIEEILSEDAPGVVKKPEPVKKKKKKNFKFVKWIVLASLGLLLIIYLAMKLYSPMYLTPHTGYYYVTDTNMLRYIDNGSDELLLEDTSQVERVEKYGKNVYFISNGTLYHHNRQNTFTVSTDVVDFKVDYYGKRVLYLNTKDDLYLFTDGESKRIDAKVALGRYIFSEHDDSIYYVTDLTDENLGTLHLKRGKQASEIVSEDVYKPVLSLKKGEVYFVREELIFGNIFDLYFSKNNKVTEVARSVETILYSPRDKNMYLVQDRNSILTFYEVIGDETVTLNQGFNQYGLMSYGDITDPIKILDSSDIFLQKNDENYYFTGELESISSSFDQFYFAHKHIYTIDDEELMISDFDGQLSNTISLDSNVEIVTISTSGEAIIYRVDDKIYYVRNDERQVLADQAEMVMMTNDDKYIAYRLKGHGYVYKVGAKSPVDLGEVELLYTNDKYVYTIVNSNLYRYKLGKFSSNHLIEKTEKLIPFELSY